MLEQWSIITLVGATALTEQLKHLGFNVSFIEEGPPPTWIQLQMKYILIALCAFRHRSLNCI